MLKPTVMIHGQGFPLVLFHGWGFNAQVWTLNLAALALHYQVHLVDLPGFGGTSPMDWHTFKEALLPQLPRQFALLGWSMGGLFATRLAIETPERVSHLINVASSPRFIKDHEWPGVEPHVFDIFYRQLNHQGKETLEQFIKLQLQGQDVDPSLFKPEEPNLIGLRQGLEVLLQWDLRDHLAMIQLPVLYIFGRLDSITSRHIMTKMQTHYAQFNYKMFSRAAHAPFLSHPNEFINTLKEFIQ